jgi:hypothetical protein
MKTCAEYRIRAADYPEATVNSKFLDAADYLVGELAAEVGDRLKQPVRTGVFSGCAGRMIGAPEISTAICFGLDPLPEDGEFLASLWCLEAPANRLIFFSRPITAEATRNLESVISALHSILIGDHRVTDLRWMDVDTWAKGEQDSPFRGGEAPV